MRRLGRGRLLGLRRLARWEFVWRLFREILTRGHEFDVLHVHQVLYPAYVASVGARLIGRPCLARVAGSGKSSEFAPANRGMLGLQLAVSRRLLTRVVATGETTRQSCLRAGFRPERVTVIHNGVSVQDRVQRRSQDMQVLWVGRFRPEKRLDLLLEAWRRADVPGRLAIVGDGPEREQVRKLSNGVLRVDLLGEVSDPTHCFRAADVFALPSDAEGMSNALLEAMAAGCACIATDVGESRDLLGVEGGVPSPGAFLRGSAGLLVARGDSSGLAAAFRALAGAPTLRSELGAAAHRRSRERYAIERVAQQYRKLYWSLREPAGTAKAAERG